MRVRKVGVVAAVAAAVLAPLGAASPAQAGVISCTRDNYTAPVAQLVNCYTDTAGYCLFYYDPVEVFPNGTATETVNYTFCNVE